MESLFDFKNKNKEIEYANTKIYLNNKLKKFRNNYFVNNIVNALDKIQKQNF